MAMELGYIPQSGDVVNLEHEQQIGGEKIIFFPVLVLSPAKYNVKTGLMLCCPITDTIKNYPFEVPLDNVAFVTGVVLSDQIKHLDWQASNAKYKGTISEQQLLEVKGKIQALLEIR